MNEEKAQVQANAEEKGISIMDILIILRSRWLIILIITLLFAVGGYIYSRIRIPKYTASVPLTFNTTVEKLEASGNDGNLVSSDGVSSTNYLYAYFDTAVEFCSSGAVIDRANVYYAMYLNEKEDLIEEARDRKLEPIDVFVQKLKAVYQEQLEEYKYYTISYMQANDKYNALVSYYKQNNKKLPETIVDGTSPYDYEALEASYEILNADYEEIKIAYKANDFSLFPTKPVKPKIKELEGYEVNENIQNIYRNKYFTVNDVGTSSSGKKDSTEYTSVVFKLQVTDYNAYYAKELVRIYALSADISINMYLEFDEMATAGFYEMINNTSGVSVSSDANRVRTVIIATLLGFIVSLLVVYVSFIADSTIKTREVLEDITGSSVIAYIDDVSEVKKNGK